ncbi:MAG TPA: VanW family protein, partial [Longimicrobium sp.]|nr:VanW family protein [Longimicrobium sp.]
PLWTESEPEERALIAGKVHNLRLALRRIDGVEVPAGGVFSFWAQVGRATRLRGFVAGRELREGCLVPSVGGGLCQLSNALYDAALRAGFEIVERHAHTRVVAGSLAERGRDATVFWNYVDLRFRAPAAFRVEARMDARTLTVRFRGHAPAPVAAVPKRIPVLRVLGNDPRSCVSCGEIECFRHIDDVGDGDFGRAAHLVDEWWPELDAHLREVRRPGDLLAIPLDGRRFRKPNYAWTTAGARVRQCWPVALERAIRSRRLVAQGAARQRALLAMAEKLARAEARALAYDVTHVVVAQGLLPYLWRDGHLGGRTFDVLMTQLSMAALHERLDLAARLHPESPTLADFRADAALVAAEAEALAHARAVVTPHAEVASLFPGRAVRLEWARPPAPPSPKRKGDGRPRIVFPGPTAGRKGAYELREAVRGMDVEVVPLGSQLEGPGFWDGVRTARPEGHPLDGADLVTLPAFVEHRPRRLLDALARGIPVVATPACGLPAGDGVTHIPLGDAKALRNAIEAVLQVGHSPV